MHGVSFIRNKEIERRVRSEKRIKNEIAEIVASVDLQKWRRTRPGYSVRNENIRVRIHDTVEPGQTVVQGVMFINIARTRLFVAWR